MKFDFKNHVLKFCLIIIVVFLQISCSKEAKIENVFTTSKNEYWKYKNSCGSHGIYFRFNEDRTYDKYNKYINDGFELFNDDGDLISGSRTWSIKNDSIFIWNKAEYKIKSYSSSKIILIYDDGKCQVTLLKDIDTKK